MLFLLVAGVCMLSACTESVDNTSKKEVVDQIYYNNQRGFDLIQDSQFTKSIEYLDKALEYVYQLDPSLIDLEQETTAELEVMDSPLNNLSWAYNELEEYGKGLEYSEKSLLILPNTDIEYTNKGNALYGLNRRDEALVYYDLAIEFDEYSISAYYGRGLIKYDRGKYKEAKEDFDKYLSIDPNDVDVVEMKVHTLLRLDENEEAIALVEDLLVTFPESYDAYKLKGVVMESTAEFKEVKAFYELMATDFPYVIEAQMSLGEMYYDYEYYDLSLHYFNQLLEKYPDNIDIYIWKIRNNSAMGDLDLAKESYAKGVSINDTYPELYNAMGNVLRDNNFYMESVEYFDKSITVDPLDENAYINKITALYRAKRNLQCVEFGKEAEKVATVYSEIAWYTGKCNLELGHYTEAIEYFERASEIDPTDSEVFSNIASAYLYLENDAKAEEYSNKSLDLYSDDWMGLNVKDALEERRKPLGKQIMTFFSDYYLYKDSIKGLDEALSKLDKVSISNREIASVLESVKRKDDRFTFTVYGDQYKQLTASSDKDLTYDDQGNISYFRINGFSRNTDDNFIAFLDRIENTEDKTLVIDLRGNTGGYTDSANNMLDALLPDYVTSTLIYRDGYTDSYYSDASHIDFKAIYIFVDEYSASASELLTLGLKTYLNNVTIVGRDTFGKGVGQRVFEDKKNEIMLFVVNHYWNVKQNNIMNTHIKPDIYVKGDQLENFMKKVKK